MRGGARARVVRSTKRAGRHCVPSAPPGPPGGATPDYAEGRDVPWLPGSRVWWVPLEVQGPRAKRAQSGLRSDHLERQREVDPEGLVVLADGKAHHRVDTRQHHGFHGAVRPWLQVGVGDPRGRRRIGRALPAPASVRSAVRNVSRSSTRCVMWARATDSSCGMLVTCRSLRCGRQHHRPRNGHFRTSRMRYFSRRTGLAADPA
jgi:hypothetical protein